MGSVIVIDKAGLKADADRFAMPATRSATRKILNRSAILCPVDTGNLRAGGRMKLTIRARGPRGIVEYIAKYAAAVHDGSAPHIIRARPGKSLRFVVDGQVVYAKSVRHPGAEARPFLADAAREIATANGYRFTRRNSATP